MSTPEKHGPLVGMRVLDLSHVMAGPVCGLMLADMGADVIKIENTEIGDTSRQMRTPSIRGQSAAFMTMNRNKRGLAVDLKRPEGQQVLKRLVHSADVLIENYRKGTMEKLGVGYDVLAKSNPGLIYCEISGFGRTGPFAEQGGFDLEHTVVGAMRTLGLPAKFSATPGSVGRGAPVLGEHSRDILAEAGYSPREIDDLIKDGVVAEPPRPVETDKQ